MVFYIREARERAGLTQAELAAKLGINAVTLSGYENGKHDPKSDTLALIAQLCDVSVDFLLGLVPSDEQCCVNDSGNAASEELRRSLHEAVDQLADDDLRLLHDVAARLLR